MKGLARQSSITRSPVRSGRAVRARRRLVDGVLAGVAGTAAMTTSSRVHREIHARRRGVAPGELPEVLDYDDSEHVVIAASSILRRVAGWTPRGPRARRAVFWAVHWGYGSAMGAAHAALRDRLGGEPAAALAFLAGSETLALGLFPLLGDTPPPWRWGPRLLTVSLVQHSVYAATVAGVGAALDRRAA